MADYIYLLENRLSAAQRSALRTVRELSRARNLTVFLVGGAVRDLTSGSPVRDLDVVVLGNALKLKKDLEKAGVLIDGENESAQALYARFPGQVRMEVGSTLSAAYPKPGKVVYKPATILEDLRRRDFTANAMALSLNEGSYGLLMDPLNGVADIENRELRLVSNYGFIEDPVRMIRAARLMARLGWTLDEKTNTRYETGKQEGYISAMPESQRGYETEEIFHEEDPLRVLRRLEAEGWMKSLAPFLTSDKVNAAELDRLREVQTQLQMQGLHPDSAAASFPLLTAKLSAKEIATLKAAFPRRGFVADIDSAEADAKELATQLAGKGAALPSQTWKMMTAARPETVLQVAFSTKSAALQAKFKSFSNEWPQSRQKMPYALMTEMRITPEISGYDELLEKLFFELMDGNLSTPEEMKAYLEPFSPPAPPPPVNLRRARAPKKEAKAPKGRGKKAVKLDGAEDEDQEPSDVEAAVVDELVEALGGDLEAADSDEEPEENEESEDEAEELPPAPVRSAPVKKAPARKAAAAPAPEPVASKEKPVAKKSAAVKSPPPPAPKPAKTLKPVPAKKSVPAAKSVPAKGTPAKSAPAKKTPPPQLAKKASVKQVPARKAVAPTKAPAKAVKAPAKAAKAPAKAVKAPAKAAKAKSAPAKKSAPPAKAARRR